MTQNEKIAEIVSRMKSHFGKGDGGGSNYYIDTYVLDELGKWLTEALSHNGEEVKFREVIRTKVEWIKKEVEEIKSSAYPKYAKLHELTLEQMILENLLRFVPEQHSTPSPAKDDFGFSVISKEEFSAHANALQNIHAPSPTVTPTEEVKLEEGKPCGHRGCLNHVTHPCEGCGRIAGRTPKPSPNPLLEEVKRRLGELSGKVYGAEIVQRELLTELIQFSEGRK